MMRATLRALPLAAFPMLAGCTTMTQAELEQCAAITQARVEGEKDRFDQLEANGFQPAIYIGHSLYAEIARHARTQIIDKKKLSAEQCPEDCPTQSRGYDFGYTNSEIESRITHQIEKIRQGKLQESQLTIRDCKDRILK